MSLWNAPDVLAMYAPHEVGNDQVDMATALISEEVYSGWVDGMSQREWRAHRQAVKQHIVEWLVLEGIPLWQAVAEADEALHDPGVLGNVRANIPEWDERRIVPSVPRLRTAPTNYTDESDFDDEDPFDAAMAEWLEEADVGDMPL